MLRHPLLASVCLLVEGVSATPVWIAEYHRFRVTDSGFAGWAVLLTLTGALGAAALPNPVDPRGVGYLAALTGIALLVLYLARLTIGDPAHPLVGIPAALAGFLLTPALYAWLGATLLRAGPHHPPPERPT